MGNEQSVPVGERSQNRLSKPKTNASTSNLLSSTSNLRSLISNSTTRQKPVATDAASTSKASYNFTPIEGFAGEAGDRWKEEQPTPRKRMSLFRSKSSQDKPKLHLTTGTGGEPNSREPSPLSALDLPPLPIWGSSNGKNSPVVFTTGGEEPYYDSPVETSRPQLRNRNSLHSSSQQARLSLVAEVPSPVDIARRQSVLQEDNASIGQAISTRSNSDAAIYVPIRRKSLLAHGVATRTSYVEPDPEPLPPRADSLKDMKSYYYDPTKPTSSPLSDLAMLGPNPAFMNEGPRAETPTEMGYGHLGGFNGTLRITNGAASPAPSSRRANSLGTEEDFFEKKNGEKGHRPGLSQRSNTISVAAEVLKSPWAVHSDSPLRTSEPQSEPLTIETRRQKDQSKFEFEKEKNALRRSESPTKGQQLANGGRKNGTLSPFSFGTSPSPTSPQFQATSKHTAVEDELFETEPESPDPSADQSGHAPRSFDSGYGGGENSPPAVPAKEFPESSTSGLGKEDSGYSSNVSLRSFKKDSSPASTRRTLNEPESRVASSTSSVESDAVIKARDFQAALPPDFPSAPLSKLPLPPFRQPPPVPMGDQSFADVPRNIQPPPIPQLTALAGHATPQADRPTSSPENSQQQNTLGGASTTVREGSAADSDISASAPATSSSRWRQKLTKRDSQPRIATKSVFTVQALRSPSEAYKIPPPTVEARRRLEEREDAFPVQCFPNTMEGTTASKRMSMNTIFSVGSLETNDQSGVPPVPPMPTIMQEATQQSRPDKSRRNTYQAPAQDPAQPPTSEAQSSQSASPERGRSQRASWARQFLQIMPRDRTAAPPEDLGFLESHVTSFETVSHSLGRDAYDAARSEQVVEPVDQRAKSMTQRFEADAAARFAASKQRSAASEPVIRPRKSYDSVMNGNRYSPGSGQSTANSLRDSRDFSHVVQNAAMRRSYTSTNLPAQSSLLNPTALPAERRNSSNSPPPSSTPARGQSVTRKPVPQPQGRSSRPSSIHTRKTTPSPLSQQQDGLAWSRRRYSSTSLVSMRTTTTFDTTTFDSSRTRPDTYEIIPIDDFKKKHPKRGSTINLSSFDDLESRPTSSSRSSMRSSMKGSSKARKRMSQSRESVVLNMRDRDVIPRISYPTLGRKSLENMRPRSKGALDAVSERDEIPQIGNQQSPMPSPLTENPNLNLKDRRWKEELKRKSQGQGQDPYHGFSEEAVPPLPRQKMKARKSEETLTLRDLQQQELAARRPKSVQPSRTEQKRMREEERAVEERKERLAVEKERAKERVKEKRKSRWDAYKEIFGERSKSVKKEQISAPIPIDRAELERSFSATPVY
ncbi:hypothetical protein N431DRAFT_473524 [Stipitochalara longipes BDJ]|nr:hypothetical protein N431DRAFT_473524 [Stipitochalara longipes BDJ]